MDEPIARRLLDRFEVSDAVKTYFLALDRFDWKTVESLVTDPFMLDAVAPGAVAHPVPRAEFMRTLIERNGGFSATIHLNPDHLVVVDGDTAQVTAHMWAAHAVGSQPADGFWGYGIYTVDLRREQARWRLSRLKIDIAGLGGEGKPADVFARSAARQAAGQGHN